MTDGKHMCPVCGKHEFEEYDSYEFCPECNWIDDAVLTENPDLRGYYKMNLNEAKKAYHDGKKIE
jgi:uncharacterized Zn finger protein (UPF0148 family)